LDNCSVASGFVVEQENGTIRHKQSKKGNGITINVAVAVAEQRVGA